MKTLEGKREELVVGRERQKDDANPVSLYGTWRDARRKTEGQIPEIRDDRV